MAEGLLNAHLRASAAAQARARTPAAGGRPEGGAEPAILPSIFDVPERLVWHWRQLVVVCNALASKCVEGGRFALALEMLKRAEGMLEQDSPALPPDARRELRAYVCDSYAHLYCARRKLRAALQFVRRSKREHQRLQQWPHVAKCLMHEAFVLSRMAKHEEVRCAAAARCAPRSSRPVCAAAHACAPPAQALATLKQVLDMVEREQLEAGGAPAQKLCLVAACFHNVAVEHLFLGNVHDACVASQNARKLARLCLSYSNRWLGHMDATHQRCLGALAKARAASAGTEDAELYRSLTHALANA